MRRDVEIRATRLSRDGVPGETFVVAPQAQFFYSFDCAAGDAATLFAWTRVGFVEAALVHDNGNRPGVVRVGSTHGFFPLDSRPYPTVAANGDTFLVTWNHEDKSLRWATVNEQGTVSSPNEFLDLVTVDSGIKPAAAAAFEDGFLLAWGTHDVRALSLDRNGHSLRGVPLSDTAALERMPALAGGSRAIAVYMRDTGLSEFAPYWRVFTRTLSGDAVPRRRSVRH
jgi:hypothetical protein